MNVKSCEKQEKSQVLLTIEVGPDEFDAAIEKAYKKNRRKYRVAGFRPGKASRKMIEAVYGREVFYDEAINEAFPDAYEAAVKEKELKVLDMPSVELDGIPSSAGFTFKAKVPVYPEVTLGQYKGLSAPKMPVKVTDDDVNQRVKRLSDRNTRLVSVEREAQNGDTVVIDFEGFLNGEPFEGGKGENHSLELGSENFVPGFEEQLVGTKAGDEKELNITFPENYAPELAGKDVVFKVKVHEVKEKDVPEIDDEFAKDVSEFDTMDELRADLRRQITAEREAAAQREFEDELMNQVADGITVDIPDVLIERQAQQFVDNLKRQVYQQGFTYEQYLKMTGGSEEKLLEDAQEPAVRQVRMDLAVTAIIEQEHLEVTDDDREAEYQKLAEQSGMDKKSVKKYFNAEQMNNQVLTQKAIAIVTDSATAFEPELKPESASAEPAPEA
ncbi:MAG: trigger factor [Oscillospiraceae bacterium]|nr:trigger factor [Oscillospiraceae bacterium]